MWRKHSIKQFQFYNILLRNEIFLHVSAAHIKTDQNIQIWQRTLPTKIWNKPKPNFNVPSTRIEYEKYGRSRIIACCAFSILSINPGEGGINLPFFTSGYRNISQYSPLSASQGLKPSSKLEETVDDLKEKVKEKLIESPSMEVEKKKGKKPIMQRIKAELLHYYHGFKLLFADTKICVKLFLKSLRGKKLTRREHRLMVRTLGDLFRLVPFSVFIVVPFLEFTLPLFLKFFPGMLPSTFQTKSQKEDKMKKKFQIQLQTAEILQNTLKSMAVGGKGQDSDNSAKFVSFFDKVRTSGGVVTSDEVMKFSKMFKDEITLDYLTRAQLKALCRVLGVRTIGTTNFLRFQISLKLRSLQADDKLIHKEGLNSLTVEELQTACQARGMPAWGVPEDRLRQQLAQWLVLSVEKKVPPSLLLLSQAFMLPSNTPTEERLAATIQSLPEGVVTATKDDIEVKEGKMDYKTKLDLLKDEMDKISKELQEMNEEQRTEPEKKDDKKSHVDAKKPAETKTVYDIPGKQGEEEIVKSQEIEALKSVLERGNRLEKEKLAGLVHEMQGYEEDSKELADLLSTLSEQGMQETKAAKRLKKKIKKMISNLDNTLSKLGDDEKLIKTELEKEAKEQAPKPQLIKIDEFVEALSKIPGKASLNHERLIEIVHRLDKNKDGYVSADLLMRMIDILGQEEVTITKQQVNELIDLLDKEEILEIDMQIIKALKKDDTISELKKELENRRAEIVEELKKEKKELDLKRKEEEKIEMRKSEQIDKNKNK